jgi:hypothetical protein
MAGMILFFVLFLSAPALAWEGYDRERNAFIGIEKGNLVRPGEMIEYFDDDEGRYYQGVVKSIERYGHSVKLEVYDFESGETRTFDMD